MRHPSSAVAFEWDEGNESELAAHNVTPWEVEALFFDGDTTFHRNKKSGTATWRMTGRHPFSGRSLQVFVLWADEDAGVLRAITGW